MIGNLTNTQRKRFPAPSFVSLGNDDTSCSAYLVTDLQIQKRLHRGSLSINLSIKQTKQIRLNREWVLNRFVAFVAFNPEVIHRHPRFQIF